MNRRLASSLFAAAAAVAAVAGAASVASADLHDNHISGIACQPYYGQSSQIAYGEPGAGNMSTTAGMSMFCPLSHDQNYFSIWRMELAYSDNSSTSPMNCYAYAVTWFGGEFWAGNKYTCSVIGGCPDATSSYTGHGYLRWDAPWGDQSLGGFATAGFACNLPPRASYASWIENMVLWNQDK
jgi:hypothetical protein